MPLTWRQRHLEAAAEDARVQGDDALREQDLLLALQADRDEGAHEVVVVDVREGAELGGGGRPDRELALFAYRLSSVQEFGDCEDACERGLDEDWTD